MERIEISGETTVEPLVGVQITTPGDLGLLHCDHAATDSHSKLAEIYQWEDFANANYGTSVEDIQWQ